MVGKGISGFLSKWSMERDCLLTHEGKQLLNAGHWKIKLKVLNLVMLTYFFASILGKVMD
jgi:hypothetical protein